MTTRTTYPLFSEANAAPAPPIEAYLKSLLARTTTDPLSSAIPSVIDRFWDDASTPLVCLSADADPANRVVVASRAVRPRFAHPWLAGDSTLSVTLDCLINRPKFLLRLRFDGMPDRARRALFNLLHTPVFDSVYNTWDGDSHLPDFRALSLEAATHLICTLGGLRGISPDIEAVPIVSGHRHKAPVDFTYPEDVEYAV